MKRTDEPKSLLEVRAWKAKASAEISRLGFAAFHKKAEAEFAEQNMRIEKRRLVKPKAA